MVLYSQVVVFIDFLLKQITFRLRSKLNPYYITGALIPEKPVNLKSIGFVDGYKAIVVWGTNLTSLVGRGRITNKESKMIKLPPYQYSVVIGMLLSDGWLTFSNSRNMNARLGFAQSGVNSMYVWYVFMILSPYCSSYLVHRIRKYEGKLTYRLHFFTRALSGFTELHYLFYPSEVKLTQKNIYSLLTPVALAHIVMGDGVAKKHGLILCTDSYTISDIVRLMNVLIIKYRLDCTLRYHTSTQPRIYIKEGSMSILRNIVRPYIIKSMLYKIDSSYCKC